MAEDDEDAIYTRDFRTVGVMWIVRHRHGGRRRFATLKDFTGARERGEVADDDALSCDGVTWRLVGRIEDLPALFEEAWDVAADEDASIYKTQEREALIDEPSVRLKFVPLPAPDKADRPDAGDASATPGPATPAEAPAGEAAAQGRGRLSARSAMMLAAATGVIMALILAAILFAVYTA